MKNIKNFRSQPSSTITHSAKYPLIVIDKTPENIEISFLVNIALLANTNTHENSLLLIGDVNVGPKLDLFERTLPPPGDTEQNEES